MEPNPVNLFAALANETRLRCLVLLVTHPELCVCELTQAMGLSQPHVSRHLAQLREAGLVSDRREGVWVYYRIRPDLPPWARQVLGHTAREISSAEPFAPDAARLAEMPDRPGAARCAWAPGGRTGFHATDEESAMTDQVYNVLFLCTGNSCPQHHRGVPDQPPGAGKVPRL